MSFYIILGTLLGARLGDVLFYHTPMEYVHDPMGIFRFWEGGLSSHGAIIGVILSLWLFCNRIKKKYPMLTWVAMFDLLTIPALFAGACIRIGNFFNQEIIGIPANVPWAIIFGHPANGGLVTPRHPVQLYEALFYFFLFIFLWVLRVKIPKMFRLGKISGLCFIGTFSFRFCIEFFKAHQSALLSRGSLLDMGQLLSIPLIMVGFLLFFFGQSSLRAHSVKGSIE